MPDVVVLSHHLWARRFAADPAVVGRTIRLSGRSFRVVGVLPDGFQHVGGTFRTYGHGEPVDVWWVLPVPNDGQPRHRYSHFFNVVGRTRADATRAAVEEDLRASSDIVRKRYPTPNSPWSVSMVPLEKEIVGSVNSTLVVLAAASSLVLLLPASMWRGCSSAVRVDARARWVFAPRSARHAGDSSGRC